MPERIQKKVERYIPFPQFSHKIFKNSDIDIFIFYGGRAGRIGPIWFIFASDIIIIKILRFVMCKLLVVSFLFEKGVPRYCPYANIVKILRCIKFGMLQQDRGTNNYTAQSIFLDPYWFFTTVFCDFVGLWSTAHTICLYVPSGCKSLVLQGERLSQKYQIEHQNFN